MPNVHGSIKIAPENSYLNLLNMSMSVPMSKLNLKTISQFNYPKNILAMYNEISKGRYSTLIEHIRKLDYDYLDKYFKCHEFEDFVSYILESEKRFGQFETPDGLNIMEYGVFCWLLGNIDSRGLQKFIYLVGSERAGNIFSKRSEHEIMRIINEAPNLLDRDEFYTLIRTYEKE